MRGTFKTYEREERIKMTEESFASGMSFTNAPLDEGFVKELINFDIKDEGEMLVPRPGLTIVEVSNNADPSSISDTSILISGKHCIQPNCEEVTQILTGVVSSEKIPDTKLYKGDLSVHSTITNELSSHYLGDSFKYVRPTKAEIHNIPISDTTPIARHVGTFAFNNDYYCFNDNLIHTKYDILQRKYVSEPIEHVNITPKEAVLWGYNMALNDPYTFTCSYATGTPQLLGLLPYSSSNKLNLTPKVNEGIKLICYWAAPQGASYKLVWEWKDIAGSTWSTIEEQNVTISDLNAWAVNFSSPVPQLMVRLTVHEKGADIKTALPLQVMVVGFNFSQSDYGSTANVDTKNYTLNTATGMTYWQNRLVLYGVKEDPTILFISDINNPGYFPYPNNVDIFDEPIIYAVPLLDSLLVFTTTSLYMLTLSEDFTSWNKSLIQSHLNINDWDLHLIRVVKNMVFFKSGNYYYMVVPKLNSTTGELVIAPISKPIASLLDNFMENVEKILKNIYNYSEVVELIHYYNYLDYEDVHNIYVFRTPKGELINFTLLYNTVSRYWRIYISESNTILKPYRQDATKKGSLMALNKDKGIDFVEYSDTSIADTYVDNIFKNYQYVDTGFKNHISDYKKRYREFQLKINNISQKELKFYTTFKIDSDLRRDCYKYTTIHHIDEGSPLYGTLTVSRELIDPSIIKSATVLASTDDDLDCWSLDNSIFPDAMFWKVRVPVSGKGYTPRLTVLSKNQKAYELLNMAWVFRLLYSR